MRELSKEQAAACENAIGPICECRCHGAAHGANRVIDVALLEPDDPHHTGEAELPFASSREVAIARIERERRAALHRQIGALELKLKYLDGLVAKPNVAMRAKLSNKIAKLKRKLTQGELSFAGQRSD